MFSDCRFSLIELSWDLKDFEFNFEALLIADNDLSLMINWSVNHQCFKFLLIDTISDSINCLPVFQRHQSVSQLPRAFSDDSKP